MYKLNKRAILGTIFIAGSILPVSMTINSINKKEEVAYVKEVEDDLLQQPIMIDQNITGCYVYKLMYRNQETKADGSNYWTDWQVTDEFYIGSNNEIYNEAIKETDTREIKKKPVGVIDNAFNYEHFIVTTRTYHEEYYDNGKWYKITEPVVLENSTDLPERCMAKWVLDSSETEKRTPTNTEEIHSLKKVRYIENTIENGKIRKSQTLETVMNADEVLENSETIQYQILEEEYFEQEMTQLYQRYEISIDNGNYQYTPNYVYTTISNIPDSEKYKWEPVGYCVYSNQLKQDLSNSSIKVFAKTKTEQV